MSSDSIKAVPEMKLTDKDHEEFVVGPNDVLLGRGSGANKALGNIRFRELVEHRKAEYKAATNTRKRQIAVEILKQVQERGGRFLQMSSRQVYEVVVSDARALKKCCHTLRERRSLPSTEKNNVSAEKDPSTASHVSEESVASTVEDEEPSKRKPAPVIDADVAEMTMGKNLLPSLVKDHETAVASILEHYEKGDTNLRIMTMKELESELYQLSQRERDEAIADMFGKYSNIKAAKRNRRVKTITGNSVYVSHALEMMRQEIEWMNDAGENEAWLEAKSKCDPQELGDIKLVAFLRCVDWHPKSAAERFAKYWKSRRRIFGPEKFYLPLTLDGALRDDMTALQTGLCVPLPERDASGRQVLWFTLCKITFQGFTLQSTLRVLWYMMEIASQNDRDGEGIVRIENYENWTSENVVADLFVEYFALTRDCWPVKVNADHSVCVAEDLCRLLMPICRPAKGKEGRIRSIIHAGTLEQGIKELPEYGIPLKMIPADCGGQSKVTIKEWIEGRRIAEISWPVDEELEAFFHGLAPDGHIFSENERESIV
mmetsp:Transcript_15784/g.28451  ORF Transcript_15784/g.28451 Transcript_15784/m.28451 type:complete len:544 (+) Transcript_15784:195-1826(+)